MQNRLFLLLPAEREIYMSKTILAVFAHPDDEAFGTGGTLAKYAGEGHRVVLVCATRGEVGEIAEGSLATRETLGQVRAEELRCAAATLGVAELIFLDYRDSGMKGTVENEDPLAFINAPTDVVVPELVRIIREVQPHIVITFEPNGGYGHPDHIAIHHHTVAAFKLAADLQYQPALGFVWQPQRLFYTAIPSSFFVEVREKMRGLGMDTADLDHFEEAGEHWPDEEVHAVVNVADWVDAKWGALSCHRTQFGPSNLFRRLPEETMKQLMGREHYSLAWPEPGPGFELSGLLEGL